MIPSQIRFQLDRLKALVASREITQVLISERTGIDQSQVSRILSGDLRRVSKNVEKLCKFEEQLHGQKFTQTQPLPQELIDAISDTWDGTPHQALALAKVIRSLKFFCHSPAGE